MTRQQIVQYYPQLKLLLKYLKGGNLCLIMLTIILYSASLYCLLKEQMVVAIGLASITAIIFHLSQKYMLIAIKRWLYRDKKNREMLLFVEQEIKKRLIYDQIGRKNSEIKVFFELLEKAMQIIHNK
ncbi:MAG: hypothetical protein KAG20_11220 [Cocleimonas sp.]|nr:hypothetical protein [Cocleimonas sp.]